MNYTRVFIFSAACLIGSCAVAAAQSDLFYGGFYGRWEGKLHILPPETFDKEHGAGPGEIEVAISYKIGIARVYYGRDGSWTELKPGNYRLLAHKTNAIITATTSAEDVEDKTGTGGWVETINLTITHKDQNGLYVVYTRMVNNYLHPFDHKSTETGLPDARYISIGYGEFTKVPE